MNFILAFIEREPVRVRAYGLAAAAATYALAKGWIDVTDADFIATALGLILGVESARAKVSPVAVEDDSARGGR